MNVRLWQFPCRATPLIANQGLALLQAHRRFRNLKNLDNFCGDFSTSTGYRQTFQEAYAIVTRTRSLSTPHLRVATDQSFVFAQNFSTRRIDRQCGQRGSSCLLMRQRNPSRPDGHDGLQRAKVLTASRRDPAPCGQQAIRRGRDQAQARAGPSRPVAA